MTVSTHATRIQAACLESILIGAVLMVAAGPARAGDRNGGRISARDLVENANEGSDKTAELLFGEHREKKNKRVRTVRPVGRQELAGGGGAAVASTADLEPPRGIAALELLENIEDGINDGRWIPFRDRGNPGRQILEQYEERTDGAPLLAGPAERSWRDRFHFDVMRGIEYRQDLPIGERGMRLDLYGPVTPGGPGLGLQLKGRVVDHRFKLKAYGTTNEGGLTVDIEF